MSTDEALRFVEDELETEDVLQADIALVLPEDGSDTDEDNADENSINTYEFNDIFINYK